MRELGIGPKIHLTEVDRRQVARSNALVHNDKSDDYSKLISDNSHD